MIKKRTLSYIAMALCLALCISAYGLQTPAAQVPTPPVQARPPQELREPETTTPVTPVATATIAPQPMVTPAPTAEAAPEKITARIATVGDLMCCLIWIKI